jgi:phosphatidylglycerophosphate synthase
MNTANKLTMLRVALIPVFLILLYLRFPFHMYFALTVFILASVTDFVDGYIAATTTRSPTLASLWTLWPTRCWSWPPCSGS